MPVAVVRSSTGPVSRKSYFRVPMRFEPEPAAVRAGEFIARGPRYAVRVSPTEASFVLAQSSSDRSAVVTLQLVHADRRAAADSFDELPGVTNYMIGNDPRQWKTGIRGYGRIRYRGIYRGIDVTYYGTQHQLEYDFVIAPGATPRAISMAVKGATNLRLDADGSLVIETKHGELVQRRPVIYQEKNGVRESIDGRFVIDRYLHVGFRPGAYDRHLPLIIDPVLSYATYLGGSGWETANGVAVDAANNLYVVGETASADFPQQNPNQLSGGGSLDAFVAKFNAAGNQLLYATYLGGSDYEYARRVAVDTDGNAYVTGSTASSDFPTVHALQPSLPRGTHAFVTKLDSSGAIVYSSYLGGSGFDEGFGIAVDQSGRAYVTGQTISTDFPTVNPLQSTLGGGPLWMTVDGGKSWNRLQPGLGTIIVMSVVVDPTNSNIAYAGTRNGVFKTVDHGRTWSLSIDIPAQALAIDTANPSTVYFGVSAYVFRSRDAGTTWTLVLDGPSNGVQGVNCLLTDPSSPGTVYAGTPSHQFSFGVLKSTDGGDHWINVGPGTDIWSLALSPAAPSTLYAGGSFGVLKNTTAGNGRSDPASTGLQARVNALAADPGDASMVYAATNAGVFKTTSGGNQWTLTQVVAPATAVTLAPGAPSTVYAGTSTGMQVSRDSGATWATLGPPVAVNGLAVDPQAPATVYVGASFSEDAFVARFSPDGSSLEYSTYFGGATSDSGEDITLDAAGNAYVIGSTSSLDFPLRNPAQSTLHGTVDLFVAKFSPDDALAYSTYLGGAQEEDGGTIAVDGQGRAHIAGYTFSPDFPTVHSYQPAFGGVYADAVVAMLSADGSELVYSTFLGGRFSERASAIAADSTGDAVVTGTTDSPDFPTMRAFQPTTAGSSDAFVARFSPDGQLKWSTYVGGTGADEGRGVALDRHGATVIVGGTGSRDFPTVSAWQPAIRGSDDAFVVRLTEDVTDPTPPTTRIDLSGTAGRDGWFRSNVIASLTATDPAGESGVAFITYTIGTGPFQRYSAPFTVTAEGATTIAASATDNSGNIETPLKTVVVKIDTGLPSLTISAPATQDYLHSDTWTASFSAADLLSGLRAGSPAATLDGVIVANGQTVKLLTLALGTHTLAVSAIDVAGNSSQQSVTFRVVATINSLIATVNIYAAQGIIDGSTQKTLLAKLTDAQAALAHGNSTAARGKLSDFIDQCTAQRDKRIPAAAADLLIGDARSVMAGL